MKTDCDLETTMKSRKETDVPESDAEDLLSKHESEDNA